SDPLAGTLLRVPRAPAIDHGGRDRPGVGAPLHRRGDDLPPLSRPRPPSRPIAPPRPPHLGRCLPRLPRRPLSHLRPTSGGAPRSPFTAPTTRFGGCSPAGDGREPSHAHSWTRGFSSARYGPAPATI